MEELNIYENPTNITPSHSGQGTNLPERSQKVDAYKNISQSLEMSTVGTSLSGAQGVKKRSYRKAAVCLGLLCAFFLGGLIVLAVLSTHHRVSEWESHCEELHISYNNVTKDRNQLKTTYNNLASERDQLLTSYNNVSNQRDQLQTSYNNLVNQRDQLQTSYNNLVNQRDQLQTSNGNLANEKQQLQKTLEQSTSWRNDLPRRLQAHNGWVYFSGSFYFVSSLEKSWNEGRADCQKKGADLMIINSREEQNFARTFKKRLWVGLTDIQTSGIWKWVDGTPLTTSYWAPGEPNRGHEHCAETMKFELENSLNDAPCSARHYWICEKRFAL